MNFNTLFAARDASFEQAHYVERMVRFIERSTGPNRKIIEKLIAYARAGKKPVNTEMQSSKEVEAAIA